MHASVACNIWARVRPAPTLGLPRWWRRSNRTEITTATTATAWCTVFTVHCTINRQDVHSYLFSHFKCLVFAWENRHFPQLYLREIRMMQKKHNLGKLTVKTLEHGIPCTMWILCKFYIILNNFLLRIITKEVHVSHACLFPFTGYAASSSRNVVAFNWVSWNMCPVPSSGAGLRCRTKTGKTLS